MKKIFFALITLPLIFGSFYGFSLTKNKAKPVSVKVKKPIIITISNITKRQSDINEAKAKEIPVKLFFPNREKLVIEERKAIYDPKTALDLLLVGPKKPGNFNYIPKGTSLLSFKVEKGNAIVNFSRHVLDPGNVGAEAEELTLFSLTNTLTQFSAIKGVIIQVEGRVEGEIDGRIIEDFWGHIGLYDQPFKANQSLVSI